MSCAVVFDREFSPEEVARFRRLVPEREPLPSRFAFEGRVVRYDCSEEEEALWRLGLEILLVKAFRESRPGRGAGGGIRDAMGLRRLHLG